MKYKKGQAAMEFLTTYGWAFLVIIVAVAGLSYFGVFDFSRYQQSSFTMDGKLQPGEAFSVDPNSELVATSFKNNYAQPVTIKRAVIYEKSKPIENKSTCEFSSVDSSGNVEPVVIGPGASGEVFFDISTEDCGIVENAGNKKTFAIDVISSVGNSAIESTNSGEMTASVMRLEAPEPLNCGAPGACGTAVLQCPNGATARCVEEDGRCIWDCNAVIGR